MRARLPLLAAALWWGSLTAVFWTVPLLFAHLSSPAVAGSMAARLFGAQTWVSLGCCLVILVASRPRDADRTATWARPVLPWVLGGLLLALLVELAVAPRIVARENLKLWHNLGTGMFMLQWLCAAVVLWQLARPAPQHEEGD